MFSNHTHTCARRYAHTHARRAARTAFKNVCAQCARWFFSDMCRARFGRPRATHADSRRRRLPKVGGVGVGRNAFVYVVARWLNECATPSIPRGKGVSVFDLCVCVVISITHAHYFADDAQHTRVIDLYLLKKKKMCC